MKMAIFYRIKFCQGKKRGLRAFLSVGGAVCQKFQHLVRQAIIEAAIPPYYWNFQ